NLLDPLLLAEERELEDAHDGRTALLRQGDAVPAEVIEVAVRRRDHVELAVLETLGKLRVLLDERVDRDPFPVGCRDEERRVPEPGDLGLRVSSRHGFPMSVSHATSGTSVFTNRSNPARSSSLKRAGSGASTSRTPTRRPSATRGTTISDR